MAARSLSRRSRRPAWVVRVHVQQARAAGSRASSVSGASSASRASSSTKTRRLAAAISVCSIRCRYLRNGVASALPLTSSRQLYSCLMIAFPAVGSADRLSPPMDFNCATCTPYFRSLSRQSHEIMVGRHVPFLRESERDTSLGRFAVRLPSWLDSRLRCQRILALPWVHNPQLDNANSR